MLLVLLQSRLGFRDRPVEGNMRKCAGPTRLKQRSHIGLALHRSREHTLHLITRLNPLFLLRAQRLSVGTQQRVFSLELSELRDCCRRQLARGEPVARLVRRGRGELVRPALLRRVVAQPAHAALGHRRPAR